MQHKLGFQFLAAAAVLLLCHTAAHPNKPHDCYGSVGGTGGHIYQYDGGVLNLGANQCSALLTTGSSGSCNVQIAAQFACKSKKFRGLSRLRKLTVTVNGKRFALLSHRRLAVNGKLQNVPYSAAGVRAFLSGDDLVLVHKKCGLWATYDGMYTATFLLNSKYRRRVSGLAGNCDGNRRNDPRGNAKSQLRNWLKKRWVSRCRLASRKQLQCHSRSQYAAAKRQCMRVISGQSPCASTDVLAACIADYCSTYRIPKLQQAVLCANFYLHSRRCARHNRPVAWRLKSACPAKCGSNQHFTARTARCPKTCENHFFGSPRRCFKLVPAEGCTCNRGFVLDGARCVRPQHCVCLAKLCIDRVQQSRCRYWRSLGRCRKFSKFMAANCRLTCGLCTPRCENQISTKLCKYYSSKGKCRDAFYRAMCQATCNPAGCGCPPRRVYTTRCSRKLLNKSIVQKRWWPDSTGKCRKSILIRYFPCGLCRTINKVIRGRCNFCKKIRISKKVRQFREKLGKRRCLRRVRRIVQRCVCKPRPASETVCYRHTSVVRVTRYWAVTRSCYGCERRVKKKVLRTLRCSGIVTVGKCRGSRQYVIKKVYRRVARNCKCILRLLRSYRWYCRCRRPSSRTICAGRRWLTITKRWLLIRGRCVLRVSRAYRVIRCARRFRKWRSCSKCRAYARVSYYSVSSCKCRRYLSAKLLGKCCCPRGYRRTIRVNRYYKKIILVTYKLVNYKCRKIVKIRKIRISCPRGGSKITCNAATGVRTFKKWRYVLRNNSCIREVRRRKSAVKCRRPVVRLPGKCIKLIGNTKYRTTKILFWRRKRCSCVRVRRTVREMCGCRSGRFVTRSSCPRGCSSRKCSINCSRYTTYYRFSARGRSCIRRVIKRLRFRCCCSSRPSVTVRCSQQQFLIRKVCKTVLRRGKCQRVCSSSSRRIRCRIGTVSTWQPHSNKAYRLRVTKTYFRRNCRCGVRVTRKLCKARCSKLRIRKFCDKVRRQRVLQKISYKLVGCRRCVRQVRERRSRVSCRTGTSLSRKCRRDGVLVLIYTHFSQSGCTCRRRMRTVTKRCRCRKPYTSRRKCRSNAWVQQVKFWILRNGKCLLRYRRLVNRVRCSSSRKYRIQCNRKLGIRRKFLGIWLPKRCRCRIVWRLVRKDRCNCTIDNNRVRNKVRRFCKNNRKVTTRYYYKLRRGRCILRSRSSSRGIRCSKPFTRRHRCNLVKRKQLYVYHTFVKRNCRCILQKRRIYRRCGCSSKVVRKRQCKKMQGIILTTVIRYRWNHRRNRCVIERHTRSHRVGCSRKVQYISGKCIRNKYYVVRKIYYVRRACRCLRRVHRKKFNCHCRNITKRYKCPRRGYFLLHITQLRAWNMKKRRCVTVKYVRRKIRCRCPRGYVKRFCKMGYRVTQIVRIVLRGGRCHRNIIRRRRRVVCNGKTRFRYTKCSKCYRYKITLKPRLNKRKCLCYYAAVRRQKCACCCPKSRRRQWCSGNTHWIVQRTHFAPFTGRKCSSKCRSWKTQNRVRVPCRRRLRLRWLRCNRRSCISKQQLSEYRLSRCRCLLRRRLTGKRRICCCRANRRTRRVCLNSCLFAKVTYNKFVPYRCVRRSRLNLLKAWRCRGRVGVVIGRCNRRSCKQRVQDKFSVVDRPYCRCRKELRNSRYRNCCCRRRSFTTRRCLGSCWKVTRNTFSFNKRRRVCVQKVKRTRTCIRCQSRRPILSTCNRRTCRKKTVTFIPFVKKCRCQFRRQVTFSVCCCRRPRTTGPQCVRGRILVWRTVSWKLRNGRCLRRVRKTSRPVRCRSGIVQRRVLRCNRATCRQRVLRKFLQLRHCRCRPVWRPITRVCCCRPAVRRWTRCEKNTQTVQYTVTRTLTSRRRCRSQKVRRVLSVIARCRSRVRIGPCHSRSRIRIVTILVRQPRSCRCQTVRTIRKRVLCRCPPARTIRGSCNKKSCYRKITKIWFTSSRKGHGVRCKRLTRVTRLRCCCHRRQRQRNFCNRRTGALMREIIWYQFAARRRICLLRRRVVLLRALRCRPTSCKMSKCSRKSGYKQRTCVIFLPKRNSCSCQRVVRRKNIVCSCRRKTVVKQCVGNSRLLTIVTYWKLSLRLNRCVRMRRQTARDLRCSKNRRIQRRCGRKCNGIKFLYFYRMRNCKCRRITKKWNIKCCCPKPSSVTRCRANRLVTTKTWYQLINYRCIRRQQQRVRYVACRRNRVTQSRCHRCKFTKTIETFGLRNCRCRRLRRRLLRLRCCCAKTVRTKVCSRGSYIKRTISYKLKNYRCLRRVQQRVYRVQCPRATVRITGCNRRTRKRKIVTIKFVKVRCSCQKRTRVQYELCSCKPPFVLRQPCRSNSIRRKVLKVSWRLVRRHGRRPYCRRIQRLLRTEPCRCRKLRRVRRCVGGNRIVTVTTRWLLKTRYGRNFCVAKNTTTERLVRCRHKYVTWTGCIRNRKTRITVYYRPVHCYCRKFVKKRVFSCNCGRLNSSRTFCDVKSGRIITIYKKFYAARGSSRCSSLTRRKIVRVVCKTRPRTVLIGRKCGLRINNGVFSQLLQKWQVRVGCKCRRRSRRLRRLCYCLSGSTVRRCENSNTKVTVRVKVVRKGNKCVRSRSVVRRRIRCRSFRPRVTFGGCDRRRCRRSATVRQCYVRKCRTQLYVRSGLQRCCTPRNTRRTFCDARTGNIVTVVTKYRLVTGKPLLRDRNGNIVVTQRQVKSSRTTRRKRVRCRRPRVIESCSRSGVWRRETISWRRVACACRRRRVVKIGKCKCPTPRTRWTRCIGRYKTRTIIRFVLRARKCIRIKQVRRFLCACQRGRTYTICNGRGYWKTCHVTYRLQFRQQRCRRIVRCRRRPQTCNGVSVKRSRCIRFKRKVITTRWRLNKRRCRCKRQTSTRLVGCNCHKRRSSFTRCIRGAYVTSYVSYVLRNERCVRRVRKVYRNIRCNGRRIARLVRGSCVKQRGKKYSGLQKQKIEWQVKVGCSCKRKSIIRWVPCICSLIRRYRTRTRRFCRSGRVWVTETVRFVLRRLRCVRTVSYRRRTIRCRGKRTVMSKCRLNKLGDSYKIVKTYVRVSNGKCGCRWKVARIQYRICLCRKTVTRRICVRNRIRRKEIWSFVVVPGRPLCRRIVRRRDVRVRCPKPYWRNSKCANCGFVKSYYKYIPRNCRCRLRRVRSLRLRCCCLKSRTVRSCDAKRHLITWVTTSYKLRNYRCIRRIYRKSVRVRCSRKLPLYRFQKCKSGYRKFKKIVYREVGCKCRSRVTQHKQRCSCSRVVTLRRGKCLAGKYFATDLLIGWRLRATGGKIGGTSKRKFKCVRVTVGTRRRRCRCPRATRSRVCRANRLYRIRISYRLKGNSCMRMRKVTLLPIGCRPQLTLLRVYKLYRSCSRRNKYVQKLRYVYVQRRSCKCVKSQRTVSYICNCFKRFGGRRTSRRCVKNRLLVTRKWWRVNVGRKCVKRNKIVKRRIRCRGSRVVAGKCGRNGRRWFSLLQKVAKNCRCVWRLKRRVSAACRCRRSVRTRRCTGGAWVTTIRYWRLIGSGMAARCRVYSRRHVRKISCKVGTFTKRTGCDARGYLKIIRTVRRLRNCRCEVQRRQSRCRCRCRRSRKYQLCRSNTIVTVWQRWQLKNCQCRSDLRRTRRIVRCPRTTVRNGACKRISGGDKKRVVVRTSYSLRNCKCKRIIKKWLRLCSCDPRPRRSVLCVGGNVRVKVTTRRVLYRGRCVRRTVSRQRVRVRCGNMRTRKICNKKTGVFTVIVIKPFVSACRCRKTVYRFTRRCGCNGRSTIISKGSCSRKTCRRRLLLKKKILKNLRCIWKRYHRFVLCCCKGGSIRRICLRRQGIVRIVTKKRVLRAGQCVTRTSERRRIIRCARKQTVQRFKLASGVLKIVTCQLVRSSCRCVRRCRTRYLRYRCDKARRSKSCVCSRGRCKRVVTVRYWQLVRGVCIRKKRIVSQPLRCRATEQTRSKCRRGKYGWYYVLLHVSWVQRKCRCVRVVRRQQRVCRCLRSSTQTVCNRRTGTITRITVSYRVAAGGRSCRRRVTRSSRRVRCNGKWKLIRKFLDGKVQVKVFRRFVRVGCACRQQQKRVRCIVRCRRCRKTVRCLRNNIVQRVSLCWRARNCRCRQTRTVQNRIVRCRRTRIVRKCNRRSCVRTVVTTRYVALKCKCVRKVRVVRNKCCCSRPRVLRQCVRGSVRIRTIRWRLVAYRCRASVSDRFQAVRCSTKTRVAIYGKCVRNRRKYSVHFWKRHGCRCVPRIRIVSRPCVCAQKSVELVFAVDLHDKNKRGYKSGVRKFIRKICSTFHNQMVLSKTSFVSFGSRVQVSQHTQQPVEQKLRQIADELFVSKKTDLGAALHRIRRMVKNRKHRHTQPIVVIISCGRHSNRARILAEAARLRKIASVVVVHVGKSNARYLRMVASRPRSHNYLPMDIRDMLKPKLHKFIASQLFERVCKRACRRSVLRRSRCNTRSCKRIYTKITYRRSSRSRSCVRKVRSWRRDCCCSRRGRISYICHSNRRIKVIISYRFNSLQQLCTKQVRRIDVSAAVLRRCRPRLSVRRGPCRRMWRLVKTVQRRVVNCRCIVTRSSRRVRCGCPSARRTSRCVGRSRRVCVTRFLLRGNTCVPRTQCSSISIVCRKSWQTVGKCRGCIRKFSKVWYIIRSCRCVRRYRVWRRRCCCSRRVIKRTYCDNKRNRIVVEKRWQKLQNGSCKKLVKRTYRAVRCSPRKVQLGKCRPVKGHYYQLVTVLQWTKRNCRCRLHRSTHSRLCRCRRARIVRSCSSGAIVYRKFYWVRTGRRCVARSRIVSRRIVTCSTRVRKILGSCSISRNGRRYRRVTLVSQKRVACRCADVTRIVLQLCACRKSYTRVTCIRGSTQITTVYRYILRRGKCVLYRRVYRRRISCTLARTSSSKCSGGRKVVKVTVYRLVRCRCVPKVYTRRVKCNLGCRDVLPSRICSSWASSKVQLCNRHPHYAAKLCARTCGLCYGCKRTSLVYAGSFCLHRHAGFSKKYIIGSAPSLKACIKRCYNNRKCRSILFLWKEKRCLMLRVTRRDVILRSRGHSLQRGGRCLLIEKVCRKSCPYRRFLQKFKCKCRFVMKKRICYRRVKVAKSYRDRSGECRRRIKILRAPCRQCEDRTHRQWCLRRLRQCATPNVRKMCPFTCGVCKRKPLVLTQKGSCVKGKRSIERMRKIYDKKTEMWIVQKWKTSQSCVRCPAGSYTIIGECVGGRRKVSRVVARRIGSKCSVKAQAKFFSCRGCPFSLRRVIGRCRRHGRSWRRHVVTFFTVRRSNRCVVLRDLRNYRCSPKCPRDYVTRSKCHCGKRIRCIRYFVTFKGSSACVPKTHSSTELCQGSGCSDRFRLIDCLTMKRMGMCRSKKMRYYCGRTCGYCK